MMDRYMLQYVVKGHDYDTGYGARYYPFATVARLAWLLSMYQFAHLFDYRVVDTKTGKVIQ